MIKKRDIKQNYSNKSDVIFISFSLNIRTNGQTEQIYKYLLLLLILSLSFHSFNHLD